VAFTGLLKANLFCWVPPSAGLAYDSVWHHFHKTVYCRTSLVASVPAPIAVPTFRPTVSRRSCHIQSIGTCSPINLELLSALLPFYHSVFESEYLPYCICWLHSVDIYWWQKVCQLCSKASLPPYSESSQPEPCTSLPTRRQNNATTDSSLTRVPLSTCVRLCQQVFSQQHARVQYGLSRHKCSLTTGECWCCWNVFWLVTTVWDGYFVLVSRPGSRLRVGRCVRQIYNLDGLRGFYRGLTASYAGKYVCVSCLELTASCLTASCEGIWRLCVLAMFLIHILGRLLGAK